jgi:hypothetical protein
MVLKQLGNLLRMRQISIETCQLEDFPSVTRLSQWLLPNVVLKFYQIGFFFTKHVQIPRFEITGCVQSL